MTTIAEFQRLEWSDYLLRRQRRDRLTLGWAIIILALLCGVMAAGA